MALHQVVGLTSGEQGKAAESGDLVKIAGGGLRQVVGKGDGAGAVVSQRDGLAWVAQEGVALERQTRSGGPPGGESGGGPVATGGGRRGGEARLGMGRRGLRQQATEATEVNAGLTAASFPPGRRQHVRQFVDEAEEIVRARPHCRRVVASASLRDRGRAPVSTALQLRDPRLQVPIAVASRGQRRLHTLQLALERRRRLRRLAIRRGLRIDVDAGRSQALTVGRGGGILGANGSQ